MNLSYYLLSSTMYIREYHYFNVIQEGIRFLSEYNVNLGAKKNIAYFDMPIKIKCKCKCKIL